MRWKMVDKYSLIKRLGSGNTGIVHLAMHVDLGRQVAIKVIPLSVVTDRDEFLDEARKLAALPDHDNLVKVHDAGDWDEHHVYIASEYCPGGSLADLADGKPLDPA